MVKDMTIDISKGLERARARWVGLPIPPVVPHGRTYRLNFFGFPIRKRASRRDEISDEGVGRLAKQLVKLTGETLDEAVRAALRERIDRLKRERCDR